MTEVEECKRQTKIITKAELVVRVNLHKYLAINHKNKNVKRTMLEIKLENQQASLDRN